MNAATDLLNRLWPQWRDWVAITRLDKPVGSYLLLWPTLWALWIAGAGQPDLQLILIFIAGVFLMRSAGCVINDFADRKVDGQVKRTADRPLANGRLSERQALTGFALLCLLAFGLVLLTNRFTVLLSFGGLALAALYPFMKRHTHLPQVFLGAAFSWAIPMAFAAQTETVPAVAWLLFAANLAWTVAYDTLYAMVDRDDDIRIGVKSTAILFGDLDLFMVGLLYAIALLSLLAVFGQTGMSWPAYMGLLAGALWLAWWLFSVRSRAREACFRAFRQNHWFGLLVWAGIVIHYLLT